MTMTSHMPLTGAKGGASKPKTPVEAPDSLQSTNIAKLLLAVGEGEFDGIPTDQDIYLDNTPIRDTNGALNFPGVKWEWRPGTPEQDYIQGIPAVENETSVGVELRSDTPFTRALTDLQLSAVRVRMAWPRLLSQDSNGNTNGYRIEYAIDIATDGGAYVEAHRGAVDGKTNNGYQRSVRVNLPTANSGWTMRVRRLTPNADKGAIADTMTIAGYTEIIDQKLRYPNTALLYIEFDAQQFQNIPAVTVDCKGRRWPVPSNYDPVTRRYDGVWDGSFKHAWTNNPAFVTYGLCVEDRFGLGKRIKPWMVDKWEMYRIAQFCDQAVPDGKGGEEPRFLCDMNLQGRAEAWTLLRDLSAIYRGMVYWAHGALFMQADMPRAQDIDYVFTRANVIDGDFVYGGAERNTHYSRALVSYDNPANNYDTDVIPVTDLALQRRYRDRPVEISAIGCTRASEAQRRGKWALLSNDQDRTVTFKTGLEGRIPLPGFVIPVADELVAGRPNGGRIAAAEGRVVTLDRDTPIKAGDRLVVNLPNGTAQARTVAAVTGRAVTVTTAYAVQPEPQLQWAIDYDDLAIQLFRVLKTTRTEDGHYAITALEFNPSKFAAIDNGAKLDERPISVLPSGTVQPPAQLTLSSSYRIDQGIAVSTLTLEWSAVEGAAGYDVEWRRDNGNWIRLPRTGMTSVDVPGIYAGAYLARVRAISAFELASSWTHSALTSLKGKDGAPPALTRLTTESLIFGIGLTWGFPAGAGDTQRTELWYSEGTDLDKATKLADLAYPQDRHTLQGLRAGQRFYFWARLVDKSGNVGVWFPSGTTLVTGVSSADAGPILEQIQGQVTESAIGQKLNERIDLVDGTGPGSVTERVTTASNAIKADVNKQLIQVNSTIDGVRSNLQGQITAVDGRVTTARDDLQKQISEVSSIAGALPYNKTKTYALDQAVLGANGKLYQAKKAVPVNMAPPNTDYWEDVGQSVRTANGTASAVSKLQMDVTTLGDTVTATSSKVDGFQASINTANSNASAAQGAAQAANDLAGGKGKVIVQNAAPAGADRLPQNLWIDTTSGANAPKRWNGSAWVSVSDKVATDAAAAAQSALNQVGSKADASAVNSLKLTVEQQGRDLTSQGSTLNGLQTAIDGKASSQALTQLTSRVKLTEDKNGLQDDTLKSQSESLTTLKDTVAKKADVSSVSQLSNTVNIQGQDVTAHGLALTGITARLGELGASGVNLLPAEYSSFGTVAPNFSGTSFTYATVADLTAFRGYALKFDWSTTSTLLTAFAAPGSSNFAANMGAKRQKYIISYYARASVTGHIIALYLRGFQSDGSTYNTPGAAQHTLTTEWARYSYVADMSAEAFTGSQMTLAIQQNRSGVGDRSIWIDRIMVEPVVNGATEPSTYVPGNSLDQVQATASAVTSLSGQVSKNAEGLKSTSELASKLDGSLTTTIGNVEKAQKAAQDAYGLADGKGKVIVQNAAPAAADRLPQNLWIDTTSGANTPKRWNGSAWAAVTDKVATEAAAAAASALSEVAKKADASAVNSLKLTVEQQGRDITAHGLDITSLNASVGNLGTSGVNLVPAEYCAFTKDLPANMYSNGGVAMSTVADAAALKGYALKAANSNVDSHTFGLNSGFTAAGCNMGFKPGKYLVSFYARAEVAGHVVGVYARVLLADGSSFKTSGAPTFTLTTTWARYVGVIDLTDRAYTGTQMQLAVQSNRSGVANRITYYDRFMLEAAVNNQVEPSTFSMGNSFDQSLANAAATIALDAKVTVNEGAITSASGQITELRNSIGDVGGENLIYNPSFEKPGANGLADGWAVASGSGATVSPSVVASALNPKESAQRINVTGISPSVWARIGNPGNRRIGLKAGTSVTLSAYVRGTPGLNVRPEIQFLNSSGSGVSGPTARFTAVSGDFVRISLSAVVPDGAVECNFFVTCYGTSSISTAFMDVDRMQFELSPTMTGWRDNGQAVTADQAATSTAVTNLTSTVGKQGGDLTTVTGQVTKLEGSVMNLQGDLPKKADVTALTTLKGTVEQNGRDIKAQGLDLTSLTTTLGGLGASGVNLLPAEYSVFSKTPPTLAGSSYNADTVADNAALRGYALKFDWSTASSALTAFFAKALNLGDANMGAKRQKYIVSYYARASVAGHVIALYLRGFQSDGSVYNNPGATQQALTTGWTRYSYVADMSADAFTGSQMILAIQLNRSGVANQSIWIDRIMVEPVVNNVSEPSTYAVGNSFDQATATATALSMTETAVGKLGDKLTVTADSVTKLTGELGKTNGNVTEEARLRVEGDKAQASKTDKVQTNLDTTNGTVKTVSDAVVKLDGKVNTSFSVRLQASTGGTHYAAGFGIGLDNNAGTFQSSFVVKADRFVVMNPVGEGLITPFAIQNGQVFINDALISNLAVQRAVVGSTIGSQALTSYGAPRMTLNFNGGEIIIQNNARSGRYIHMREDGIFMVSDGIIAIELSL
ncbi:TipJ family phage tail tip protein [Pseudomonas alabamensis]|uniref:TipJ family phage tail tip protein n=1 Tax=Pseudomonas alabamensis TaxID=3064349 RepID=UPI003986D1C3